MTLTLTVTDIAARFDGQHGIRSSLTKASPFIKVQAARGDFSYVQAANVEHGHGKTAAWASRPVTLERAGSHLVIKVTARAKDSFAASTMPAHTEDTIASARVLAESPRGSNGVQTAVLVDSQGRAAGEVTCKVEEVPDDEAVPDTPSSTTSNTSTGSSVGAHVKNALETAAEKTLKLASCMWTAPKAAYTDSEAVYRHQDTFCAAFGTFPTPMTGTSFLRM